MIQEFSLEFALRKLRVAFSQAGGKQLLPQFRQLECFSQSLVGRHPSQNADIFTMSRSGFRVHDTANIMRRRITSNMPHCAGGFETA
jgi:hypothetical protein